MQVIKMKQRRMNNGALEILDGDERVIMTIRETVEDQEMKIAVSGTIKNEVAHDFEDELMAAVSVCPKLAIDMSQTDYIASMALRSLLSVQQMMDNLDGAEMRIRISPAIRPIFEESGFFDILNIEE